MTVHVRAGLRAGDQELVRAIVASTGFFSAEEVDVAVELVQEREQRGAASGYWFLFLEDGARTVGYSCYGPIAATRASWDLYWIAVDAHAQGRGHGRALMRASEQDIARRGGSRVYVDTSSRAQYAPTRAFYESCGYRREAELVDFYAPGDGKVIYVKLLEGAGG